ncbi:MAG: MiaB/RimO family radical SAM methylthiotransferase [Longimicrobiales bacterium]
MRVHYKTFGCKANQADTERIRQTLQDGGLSGDGVTTLAEADLCVVNTCTVTNQADADARRFVRRVRRENPDAQVVVAGCSAALRAPEYESMPEVSFVVQGHDAGEVFRAVESLVSPPKSPLVSLGASGPLDQTSLESIGATVLRRRAGATRGWLKVQDGCDRKCAFCATRLARGVSRSRPVEVVVEEARSLARSHPELVITGIHIGHYGLDLPEKRTLSYLAARLLEAVPDVRFRLGSIEATEVDDELIRLMTDSDGRLVPHLHMPLQSGADSVLRRMRRWHTREQYRVRALEIGALVGPLGLGADVITGFPGETDADHADTVRLIEELPFTYLHVFPFSPRDGTVAASLPDPVQSSVARVRARELRALADDKTHAYRARQGGTRTTVVLEGGGGKALTGDYLRVAVGDSDLDPGRLHEGWLSRDGSRFRIDGAPVEGMN